MWILVINELKMLRAYLMQIFGFILLVMVVFLRSSPQFVTSYFTIFPIIMAMTLPQISFTQEERNKTFVFLRSLPLRPQHIVAAKYIVSFLITTMFWALILIATNILPTLNLSYALAAFVIVVASLAAGVSYFQHFMLGLKSAKVVLLITFLAISAPLMLLSQNPSVQAWFASDSGARSYAMANTILGSLAGLAVGAVLMLISYQMSATLFSRRDVSQLP